MGNMRDQMEALTQGIAASARERQLAVGDSKVQTARMLQAFGRERAVMAKTLKSGLAADRVGRSVNACAIRANTGTMRHEFHQDHVRMRCSLRRRLAQSTEAVATCVASLRADFAKARADFVKAHRHMAKAQRTELAKDCRDRSREVAELMNDFHASRGEMARELAERLAKSTQEIRSEVSGLNRFRAPLEKIRENAWFPPQIPNSLLATQTGAATPVPISGTSREPDKRQEKTGKKKTTVAKAVRAFVRKQGKPKKR